MLQLVGLDLGQAAEPNNYKRLNENSTHLLSGTEMSVEIKFKLKWKEYWLSDIAPATNSQMLMAGVA